MHATFSIQVNVTDKQALWDAAAANAVSSGSHESPATYKAEFGIERVTDHLRFLLDRPLTLKNPAGFEVVDSYCDVDTVPTPEGNAQITLLAAFTEPAAGVFVAAQPHPLCAFSDRADHAQIHVQNGHR